MSDTVVVTVPKHSVEHVVTALRALGYGPAADQLAKAKVAADSPHPPFHVGVLMRRDAAEDLRRFVVSLLPVADMANAALNPVRATVQDASAGA